MAKKKLVTFAESPRQRPTIIFYVFVAYATKERGSGVRSLVPGVWFPKKSDREKNRSQNDVLSQELFTWRDRKKNQNFC
jgi:hypothetical protein